MNRLCDLSGKRKEIREKRVVAGFDGFVDTTVRPIAQTATASSEAKMFATIQEFGEFLVSKAGKSCSVELKVEPKSLGGNMPYFSLGAGSLGLDVTCIGMLGEGGRAEDVFSALPCTLYPFAPPGESTCMEFQDGKVMLAPSCECSGDVWEQVMKCTSGQANQMFSKADLIALVNWSELSFSQRLWQETYDHGLSKECCNKGQFAFFDLCDISRKMPEEVEGVLRLIGMFATKRTTILSMNENEAVTIGKQLLGGCQDRAEIAHEVRKRYGIDEVLIHTLKDSLLMSSRGIVRIPTDFVENPVKSTGAGDHFNAASCLGVLMGLCDEERVILANRVSSFYVRNGYSPRLEEISAGFCKRTEI
ncbi:MAG: carbohydrate kinase family protein [Hungatella sp.]|jgi:hypothetical protein|nr:carbohydrate kinase family protein [Hungatella sp.]